MSDPIFMLGIMPRSGTNFLWDLVQLHPDIAVPDPVKEDFVVAHSHLLHRFVSNAYAHWSPEWGVDEGLRRELTERLGAAVIDFLAARAGGRRFVTKTPSVRSLEHVFEFFPDARVVIVIRDGRSVIESGVRTFGWEYERAMRRFATAARTIIRFQESGGAPRDRYRVVRYEDAFRDPARTMGELLTFLELDPSRYDFSAACNLPVRGSSRVLERSDEIHWEPVTDLKDFNPVKRWRDWDRARHGRFNWIAGHWQRKLGYDLVEAEGRGRVVWKLRNRALDSGQALGEEARALWAMSGRLLGRLRGMLVSGPKDAAK